ncbi:hypothetical protein OAD22_09870 [Pseudomonadales bacterium]|nr:hypothetical protein [Pseudomonadales bacterium]MDB9918060.1 hypothetical protein [Pseudomonadales bacterium]MDC1368725.1 hypothetical protein [Pseudomonadales bacterium]
MMNKALIILSLTFLASCGPSAEEKKNIAAVTCSIMNETGNMDGAIRVREMNDAREKIGGEPFLQGDSAIKEAFGYGLCEELVLHVENYDEIIKPLRDATQERERIAAEKRAEEIRAEEIRAEEIRAAKEKRVEENRIAAEKQRISDAKPSVKEEFHSNGKLKTRINYQSKNDGGREDGLAEWYRENGQLSLKINYKDGVYDGLTERYHNGHLFSKRNYKKGRRHGLTEQYDGNGQLRSKANYKGGNHHGLVEYYKENGELYYKECYRYDVIKDMSYCKK